MKRYHATENDAGVRLSRFVLRVAPKLTEGVLHKSFRNKRVKVNGKRADAAYRLASGDVVELYINDAFFAEASNVPSVDERGVPYGIVYEDNRIAVLQKPAGVLCHSDNTGDATLLGCYTANLIAKGEYNPATANGFAPALCNRLDRGTEGLVLLAKRYDALRDANDSIKCGLLHKTYLCITAGKPAKGVHDAWLVRDKNTKTSRIFATRKEDAKAVRTGVQVLEEKAGYALCEVALFTGRTHQIRSHLAFLGAPLLGDRRYGKHPCNTILPGLRGQALCAYKLRFDDALPQNSTLADLAGREFTVHSPTLLKTWETL